MSKSIPLKKIVVKLGLYIKTFGQYTDRGKIQSISVIIFFVGLIFLVSFPYNAQAFTDNPNQYYQERRFHSPDGIGKFYLGREIAHVMGHQEILWLERPSRNIQELPDQVVAALNLQPTDIVADIGAGTGYFSFRMATKVPDGKVLAVDIQPEMLNALDFLKTENQITNVETILGTVSNPRLANNSIDLVLMVDAYHEFAFPREMMTKIVKALKPGGQVVLVEYRGENPLIPIKGLHKMTQKQVKKEMAAVGLVWLKTQDFLPQQHLLFFQKEVVK